MTPYILDHVNRVTRPLQMSTSIYTIKPEIFRVHQTYDVRVLSIGSSNPIRPCSVISNTYGLDEIEKN
jgi:hypothetical protein